MKVKMIDQEAFYMAGIVDYGECSKHSKHARHRFIHKNRPNREEEGHQSEKSNQSEGANQRKSINIEIPDMNEAMNKLGEIVGNMGKHIEKNAPGWERDIKEFGNNFEDRMEKFSEDMDDFGRKMDTWGEDFGNKMEAWGKNFGKKMEAWGDDLSKNRDRYGANTEENWSHIWEAGDEEDAQINAWLNQYPAYDTYKQVYEDQLIKEEAVIQRKSFYEVQILESNTSDSKAMVMFASRLDQLIPIEYPAVLMTFKPDRWMVVKVTLDEYKKDWLGRLAELDLLKGYSIEPYFMIKHNKKERDQLIKIYCPLKEKAYEG